MKIKVFLFLYLAVNFSLWGQSPDTSRFQLELGLTGNVQTGNFERLQFINQLNVSFDFQDKKWNFTSRHLYLYQKVFGNTSQDDYLTRNFLTYRFHERLNVFAVLFLEKYLIKQIDLHKQYGLGGRYSLVNTNRTFIQLGLMGSYSQKEYFTSNFADFDNNGDTNIKGFFISPILNSSFGLISGRLYFNLLFWFQQDISEGQNWRFNLESALLVPVRKGFNLKVSFNNFYENINLVGTKANDTFLTYGLTYKIYH